MIRKIISGGQAEAERAGLDAAIESDIEHGGWAPKGKKSEDGVIPEKYNLTELTRGGYPKCTEKNIMDSDGTVIFTYGKLTTGSALARRLARKHNKPYLHIDLDVEQDPAFVLKDWLIEWDIKTLNVAGQRASKAPEIYDRVKCVLNVCTMSKPNRAMKRKLNTSG